MKFPATFLAAAVVFASVISAANAQYSSAYPNGMPNTLGTLGATQTPTLAPAAPGATAAGPAGGCTGDYRAVAICALKAVLKGYSVERAEISPLKETRGPQLGDMMTCVKAKGVNGDDGYFAVFLENGKYLDTRRAVGFDGCQNESYAPAPRPVVAAVNKDKKKPATRR